MRETRTRTEIEHGVSRSIDEIHRKGEQLEHAASDRGITRELDGELELEGGTAEGQQAVRETLRETEETATEIYEHEDDEMAELQRGAGELADDLCDSSERVGQDADRLVDAGGRIHGKEVSDHLRTAERTARSDVEFLEDEEAKAREARDESERLRSAASDLAG